MSPEPPYHSIAAIEARSRTMQAEMDRIEKAVDRMASPERIDFHNQLDLFTQRRGAVDRQLERLRAGDDATGQEGLRRRLAGELDELGQALRQVADRVDRRRARPADSR